MRLSCSRLADVHDEATGMSGKDLLGPKAELSPEFSAWLGTHPTHSRYLKIRD